MKFKKLLSLLLTTGLVLSCAACGSNEQTADTPATSVASNQEASKDAGNDAKAEEPLWPEDVSLTYYLRGGTAEYEPYLYKDLVGINKIQEESGIDLDFNVICGTGDEIQAQYLSMIASGNYPDVIQWLHNEQYVGGVDQLYKDGVIIELNELIENHMPNLKKILEEHPNLAKDMANDDGQYLYFTVLNPMESTADILSICYWGFLMRKDWLENLGLDAPTNIDEWYEVLKAFKTQDPNGNGMDDEIPFDAGAAGLSLFMPSFDINTGVYIDPKTGKVGYGEYSDNYKEFLTTMNKWYSEGLIANVYDEAYKPVDGAITDENIYGDIAGSWKGLANNWEQRLPGILEKNANADLVALEWPESMFTAGTKYTPNKNYSTLDRTSTCISVDCEYPEAAAAIIDYMYSEDGGMYLTWGVEGETYETDANGEHKWTDYANELITYYDGNFARKYTYAMAHISFPRFAQMDVNANQPEKYVAACEVWADCDTSLIYPKAITVSQEAQQAVLGTETDLGDYIAEMTAKFITGEEPLTNFDNYRDTLKKMGIEDLIALYQDAYDRYNAR